MRFGDKNVRMKREIKKVTEREREREREREIETEKIERKR